MDNSDDAAIQDAIAKAQQQQLPVVGVRGITDGALAGGNQARPAATPTSVPPPVAAPDPVPPPAAAPAQPLPAFGVRGVPDGTLAAGSPARPVAAPGPISAAVAATNTGTPALAPNTGTPAFDPYKELFNSIGTGIKKGLLDPAANTANRLVNSVTGAGNLVNGAINAGADALGHNGNVLGYIPALNTNVGGDQPTAPQTSIQPTAPPKPAVAPAAATPAAAAPAPITARTNAGVSGAPTIANAVAPAAPPAPQYTLGQNATEIIRPGGDRTVSLFGAGANGSTSEVPGDVYDGGSGKIAQYQAAQVQKGINQADPLAAFTQSEIDKEKVRNAGIEGVASIQQAGEYKRFKESSPQQLGDFQVGMLTDLASGDPARIKGAETRQQAFQKYTGTLTLKEKGELYNHYLAAAKGNFVENPLTLEEWSSKLGALGAVNQPGQTGQTNPPLPSDPTKRKAGVTYAAPAGNVLWDGKGLKRVQ